MKFNKWSRKRIREGKKTLTSRKKEGEYGVDRDISQIIGPLPWWFINRYLYRDEGADSPEELQRVINQIFRRQVGDIQYAPAFSLSYFVEGKVYGDTRQVS